MTANQQILDDGAQVKISAARKMNKCNCQCVLVGNIPLVEQDGRQLENVSYLRSCLLTSIATDMYLQHSLNAAIHLDSILMTKKN